MRPINNIVSGNNNLRESNNNNGNGNNNRIVMNLKRQQNCRIMSQITMRCKEGVRLL